MEEVEPTKSRRANSLGPTGNRVAENLARIRKERGLTTGQVVAVMAELGRPIPATGVTKIELGDRRVDVDDLVALAVALNVSPLTLLLPPTSNNEQVALTDNCQVSSRTAWQWAEGQRTAMDWEPGEDVSLAAPGADPAIPLRAYERDQEFGRQQAAYLALAQPEVRRRATQHSAIRIVRDLEDVIADLVAPSPDMDRAGLAALNRMARRRHQQLGIELEEISEQLPPVHPGVPASDGTDEG
ncbi:MULTISPECIES: helix-turn-helix transcriptional regulator [unclassified Kitasatospora]|uniref:helix-turn-helix domain-containing protein n=1 Tax=unclassified Kitasatospora TaxID=2633591 RepID=UPI0024772803|nr:helix-turn-helix transcriptional regulator [Kitasatospora sp. GAS204B]